MGIFDFIKKGKTNPKKIVDSSWEIIATKSAGQIKDLAEDAAKEVITDIASDVINAEIDKMGNIPSGYLRDKLVEKSVELCVDKAWDKLKG